MLSRLVTIALARGSVLTSLMVKLNCESAAERWLAPPFVFFFQMLYPFPWVNDPARRTAAAAGGCMLVRREALRAAGGLEALRSSLIDDCALGRIMKRQGPIWLGLTDDVRSMRPYPAFADFRRMVVRSAFAELRYSPLRLVAAVSGMALVYLAPPLLVVFCRGVPQAGGALAWAMMAVAIAPTLRLYGRPLAAGFGLPAVAAAYVAYTLESALEYRRGRGGYWKGRFQAPARGGPVMTTATETLSGKASGDENFPVASWLLSEERRAPILAYYRFARAADDVADHPNLPPDEKLALLDRLDGALRGRGLPDPEAEPLRIQLSVRGLSPRHALELLDAFRQDVRKTRYADWGELMDYCRLSAAPVGRFVLDVHEEDERLWPGSDALCAALQVINHLQDCAKDFAQLDRVYLPEDILRRHGASVAMLARPLRRRRSAPPWPRSAGAQASSSRTARR